MAKGINARDWFYRQSFHSNIETPKPARRRERDPECTFCQKLIAEGTTFAPPHDASDGCESGKREHCSCDFCF